jgi:hypothetical protein
MSTTPSHAPDDLLGPEPASRPPVRRHALGLPAGSVRALLALLVLGLLWAIVLLYKPLEDDLTKNVPLLFVQLQYLMVLILAHFFTAHGNSIGTPEVDTRSPLGLPRGSIRLILILGFAGLVAWIHYYKPEFEEPLKAPTTAPLVLLAGFFVGYLLTRLVRTLAGGQTPFWYQDLEAWVSLLAMLGLGFELVYYLFIWPDLRPDQRLNLAQFESGLAAVIGLYFGARS